jgi:hypothetical protein
MRHPETHRATRQDVPGPPSGRMLRGAESEVEQTHNYISRVGCNLHEAIRNRAAELIRSYRRALHSGIARAHETTNREAGARGWDPAAVDCMMREVEERGVGGFSSLQRAGAGESRGSPPVHQQDESEYAKASEAGSERGRRRHQGYQDDRPSAGREDAGRSFDQEDRRPAGFRGEDPDPPVGPPPRRDQGASQAASQALGLGLEAIQGMTNAMNAIANQVIRSSGRSGRNAGWPYFDGTFRDYPAFKRKFESFQMTYHRGTPKRELFQQFREMCLPEKLSVKIK